MNTTHPLLDYSRRSGTPLRQIAKDAGCSRMTLYRLMRGEQNATIGLIQRVSAATNGAVAAEDFFPQPAPDHKQGATPAPDMGGRA